MDDQRTEKQEPVAVGSDSNEGLGAWEKGTGMEILDESEIRKMIRRECKEFGSLRNFANHLGVSAAFVSDVARGNREPSGKILKHFGLIKDVRRVVIFFKDGSA